MKNIFQKILPVSCGLLLVSTGCTSTLNEPNKSINTTNVSTTQNQLASNTQLQTQTLQQSQTQPQFMSTNVSTTTDAQLKEQLVQKYQVPKQWGENIPGVKTRLATDDKVIALTFDACGGTNGNKYDAELIYYIRQWGIPATLFINSRWVDANYWTFMALSKISLFEIENHGTLHKPLSMNGKEAWGIKGTENVGQIVDEVLNNHRKIEQLTGRAPKFFRSGTAFYDEVGVSIVNDIGEQVAGYNVLGDAGATFNRYQVRDALLNAKPGSIALLHMNHPESETAEGVKLAVPELLKRGYKFVRLEDYPLL